MAEAHVIVDHHMAAHGGRAIGKAELELVAGAFAQGGGEGQVLGLVADALVHVEAGDTGFVRAPGVAVKAGVEVDVTLDKARNDELSAQVHAVRSGGGDVAADGLDASIAHRDGDGFAAVEAGIGEQHIGHLVSPLLTFGMSGGLRGTPPGKIRRWAGSPARLRPASSCP